MIQGHLFSPRAIKIALQGTSYETPPDADFFLQHTGPGSGAISAVDYSGDSKTDELIKIPLFYDFPPDMDAFVPKIKK